ncbi:Ig-like domain-containing protein [Micromonosporaceae bacterium Da 78-11]
MSDGNGGTAKSTVTITITDGNPVALPDTRTTPYQHAVTVPVLVNDFAPGTPLTLTDVTKPDHGTATLSGGAVTFTPAAGFSGIVKFSYSAADADGNKTTATVTVTVGTPPVVPVKAVTAKPGTALTVKLPVTDKNGKKITVISVGKPKHGTAVLNADGTVTYTAADGFAGMDSFAYQVRDADGNVAAASVQVTVTGPNKAPAAHNDAVTVDAGGSLVVKPLVNDLDPNEDPIKIIKIGKPRHGTAVLNADGTVTYAPSQTYVSGIDSFTYTISDGRGGTSTATVTVTVAGTADGNLAKTGQNVVTVVGAGALTVLLGGALYWAGTRSGFAVPGLALIGVERRGPGRHRPGRHRE